MADLLARLQLALGDRYRIERELGGGGMSHVFRAEESRLGRMVVIKVLPPQTSATIEAGRFEREIQVAASLHHPHIVQLLAAGNADGLLWYAMPFVEGESLSERLARGPLPFNDAVRITCEVADALAYAHGHGIVHRDIKPPNIMLSGRHALVTDFGVAKAVSASAEQHNTLTSAGMALGTPAYMAPEQAVADPNVDRRADIYALGVVAYEMFTGASPYDATTPQALLAAHVTQQPHPILERRPDLPPKVGDIVMRCLAKSPDDRWQNAGELVDALEGMTTPSTGTAAFDAVTSARSKYRRWHPARVVLTHLAVSAVVTAAAYALTRLAALPDWVWWTVGVVMLAGLPAMLLASRNERRRAQATMTGMHAAVRRNEFTGRRAVVGGAMALAAVLLVVSGFVASRLFGIGPGATLLSAGRLNAGDALVLADFHNSSADSTLGNAVVEALRVDLGESRSVNLVDATQVASVLNLMNLPATTRLTDTVAREVAQRANAKAVLTGDITPLGTGFVLTASMVDAATGQPLVQVRETADNDNGLIDAVNRLSKSLREKIGESLRSIRGSEPLEQVTTASLPALRDYSRAVRLFAANDLSGARELLLQTVQIDSTFAMAWRKLAALYTNPGVLDPAGERLSATNAYRFRDHLTPFERDLTEGTYFNSVTFQYDSSLAAYRAALEISPDDPIATNNAAVILEATGQHAEAEQLLRRGINASPTAALYGNLQVTLAAEGKRAALDSIPDEWLAATHDSTVAAMFSLDGKVLARDFAGFDSTAAIAAPRLTGAASRATLLSDQGSMAAYRGQLAQSARLVAQSAAAVGTGAAQRAQILTAQLVPALFDAIQRADPSAAARDVAAALAETPLDSVPPLDRPYWLLATIAGWSGRPADFTRYRNAWEAVVPAAARNPTTIATFDVYGAFAQHDWGKARDVIEQLRDKYHCDLCMEYELAYAFDQLGQADSAAAYYAARIHAGSSWDPMDPNYYPLALVRLGEIAQQKGDRKAAAAYYTKFLDLWKNADPDMQPRVREVRQHLAEVTAESSRP